MIKLIAIIMMVPFVTTLWSQNELTAFGGVNITSTRLSYKGSIDSVYNHEYLILPSIGIDVKFNINKNIKFITGLGINFLGSKNYNINIPNIENFRIDPNLRLGYIRVPMKAQFNITELITLKFGYSLNYNFRKNQNFYTISNLNEPVNIYTPIHHYGHFGIGINLSEFEISFEYQKSISKIWDTKDLDANNRSHLSLSGLQLTFGKRIKN